MIDTVKIAFVIKSPYTESELEFLGWQRIFDERTGRQIGWNYKEKGNRFPYLTLFTAQDGIHYLTARVSLPDFVFGSNAQLLNQDEVNQGIVNLSRYISQKTGFEIDIYTAIVWEIHFTKDYYIGDSDMTSVINRLSKMNIPRYRNGKYSDSTLYFHSKGLGREEVKPRTICIYDKGRDCVNKGFSEKDIEKTRGTLRLESRFRTTKAVKRLVKNLKLSSNEVQHLFNLEVSNKVLEPIQSQILKSVEETNLPSRIYTLIKAFPKRRVPQLIQFLLYFQVFGADFHKNKSLNFNQSSYYGCLKDCRNAGILYLFDDNESRFKITDLP